MVNNRLTSVGCRLGKITEMNIPSLQYRSTRLKETVDDHVHKQREISLLTFAKMFIIF